MKTRRIVLALLAIAVGLPALLPGDVARADERARSGVWLYDVRIVRVDPAVAEGIEAMSIFEEAEGTTVPMGWPQILGILKKRGKTTIFVDQRVTAMDGGKCHVNSRREVPVVAVNFTDDNNTQKRSATVQSGCKCEFSSDARGMTYDVDVRWSLPHHPIKSSEAPPQLTTTWRGTHPALGGQTLVLHYREQIDAFGIETVKPVELYAVITGRFIVR